jgi:hypothetical protein
MDSKHPLSQANIITLLGVESLPQGDREELLETATQLVETRVLARVVHLLSDAELQKFNWHMERDEMEFATTLLKQKGISLFDLYDEEVERVKKELLSINEEAETLLLEEEK